MSTRLDRLREQRDALNERLKTLAAKQRQTDRQMQTRQRMLLGKMVQEWMQEDADFRRVAKSRLQKFLTRRVDRQAFDHADSQQEI